MMMPIRGPAISRNIIVILKALAYFSASLFCAEGALAAQLTDATIAARGDAIEVAVALSGPAAHAVKLSSGGLIATISISGLETPPQPRRLNSAGTFLASALIEPGSRAGDAVILLVGSKPMQLGEAAGSGTNGFVVSLLPVAAAHSASIPDLTAPALEAVNFPVVPPLPSAPHFSNRPLPPVPIGLGADDPLLQRAAKGEEAALLDIATFCLGSHPPQAETAQRWLEYASSRGSALASFDLGQMARRGLAGGVDETAALRWYRLSASRGFAAAKYNLALMLLEGRAAPADIPEARRLLKSAADQGYDPAKTVLAELNRAN